MIYRQYCKIDSKFSNQHCVHFNEIKKKNTVRKSSYILSSTIFPLEFYYKYHQKTLAYYNISLYQKEYELKWIDCICHFWEILFERPMSLFDNVFISSLVWISNDFKRFL